MKYLLCFLIVILILYKPLNEADSILGVLAPFILVLFSGYILYLIEGDKTEREEEELANDLYERCE